MTMVISKADKHEIKRLWRPVEREQPSAREPTSAQQPARFGAITISAVLKPVLPLPSAAAAIFYLLLPR